MDRRGFYEKVMPKQNDKNVPIVTVVTSYIIHKTRLELACNIF